VVRARDGLDGGLDGGDGGLVVGGHLGELPHLVGVEAPRQVDDDAVQGGALPLQHGELALQHQDLFVDVLELGLQAARQAANEGLVGKVGGQGVRAALPAVVEVHGERRRHFILSMFFCEKVAYK
jgi:hypothetical protein